MHEADLRSSTIEKWLEKWADINITMQPETAFVIGDHIFTTIEIGVCLMHNQTLDIMIIFPECNTIPSDFVYNTIPTDSIYERPINLWN